jgi:plastocyanin
VLLGASAAVLLATPAVGATQGVRVGSFYFEDDSAGDGRVVVDQGDRIRFTFEGGAQHTATVDGLFDSDARSSGQTYTTAALTRAGTYTLFCRIHGASRHGTTLVVRATAAPSPTPPRSPSARPSPSPKPRPSKPGPAPSPAPVPAATSPAPAPTAAAPSPSPSPSLLIIPAPSDPPRATAAPAPPASPSASPSAEPVGDDIGSVDSSGSGLFVVPWWLVALVLAGVLGTVVAARRRRAP